MNKLKNINEFKKLSAEGKHIFLFTANWCPDCRIIEPALSEIEKNHKEYKFILVDRDKFIDLCGELNVFGIPSFLAYEDGKEIGRFVSKERKTKEEIEQFIDGLNE